MVILNRKQCEEACDKHNLHEQNIYNQTLTCKNVKTNTAHSAYCCILAMLNSPKNGVMKTISHFLGRQAKPTYTINKYLGRILVRR